jgi:hypothetical protein
MADLAYYDCKVNCTAYFTASVGLMPELLILPDIMAIAIE